LSRFVAKAELEKQPFGEKPQRSALSAVLTLAQIAVNDRIPSFL